MKNDKKSKKNAEKKNEQAHEGDFVADSKSDAMDAETVGNIESDAMDDGGEIGEGETKPDGDVKNVHDTDANADSEWNNPELVIGPSGHNLYPEAGTEFSPTGHGGGNPELDGTGEGREEALAEKEEDEKS